MTIAAGFRCEDGIIMCSDSEYSYSDIRLRGQKMFHIPAPNCGVNLVVAFAGMVDYARMLVRKIDEKLRKEAISQFSEADLAGLLERVLISFHRSHIFKHPRYGYSDGPSVAMVIAASMINERRLSLFSTWETAVNIEDEFATVGSGKGMADYVVLPLSIRPFHCLKRKDIVLLATHMLYQVKTHMPGCGGMSNFVLLENTKRLSPVTDWEIPSHQDYSKTFTEILSSLFFAMGDLEIDDPTVQHTLKITQRMAQIIREEQRAETEKRERLIQKMHEIRTTTPSSPTVPAQPPEQSGGAVPGSGS